MEERYKKLMAQAMTRIGELEQQLVASNRDANEPIAIIGLGCRFPGGDTPQAFWETLQNGVDTVSEIPADRWDVDAYFDAEPAARGKSYCRAASFINDVFDFDPGFFGISPREAQMLDPQQRLLMETTWQTLENAGIAPDRLRGSQTGVFIGSMSYDFLQTVTDADSVDVHTATGIALSVASGRLSYLLDLHGPTLSVDTACSSSLVAVHLACLSLHTKECDLSLAGGVNVMTSPLMVVAESAANMLAPDGRCKTFDAAANGYGRGEGCGMVLLKRLADAVADNDEIYAVIRGSAINHDGQSSGLTVPNPQAQMAVMRSALENAGAEPEQVSYVEAHGTGTPLGDPIEIGGLQSVYCRERTKENPLVVGSVKSNIGHLEGAAGVAALIKTALCLHHGEIPPHQHFKNPNPHMDWQNLPIEIPVRSTPWPAGQAAAMAGVSSFGFSGTNVHVVVAAAPPLPEQTVASRPVQDNHLLAISAKTESALEQAAGDYIGLLEGMAESDIGDFCFSVNSGRNHYQHRFAATVSSTRDALAKLQGFVDKTTRPGHRQGNLRGPKPAGAVFVFADHGEQIDSLKHMYETQRVFRDSFDRCDQQVRKLLDRSLSEAITGSASGDQDTAFSQSLNFAVQLSWARFWESLGIAAAAVLGQGNGEYVAACVAGVFSPKQALSMICCKESLSGLGVTPDVPYGSGVTGALCSQEVARPSYWRDLASAPSRATQARAALACSGEDIFLEIGQGAVPDILAELYASGLDLDWRGLYGDAPYTRIALPGYPFQRKRYRFAATTASDHGSPEATRQHPLLGRYRAPDPDSPIHLWRGLVDGRELTWLRDHRIGGQGVFPAVGYVEMVLSAFTALHQGEPVRIPEILFERPLLIDGEGPFKLETRFTQGVDGAYDFEILSRSGDAAQVRNASGRIVKAARKTQTLALEDLLEGCEAGLDAEAFYDAWAERGNHWQGAFRGIERIWKKDNERIARISTSGDERRAFFAPPALLDACGQLLTSFALDGDMAGMCMAGKLGDITFFAPLRGETFWSHAVRDQGADSGRSLSGSIAILDDAGNLLADVGGCSFEFVDMANLGNGVEDALYDVQWKEVTPPQNAATQQTQWLVLADADGMAERLFQALQERGATAELLAVGTDVQNAQATGSAQCIVDLRCLDADGPDGDKIALAGKLTEGIVGTLSHIGPGRSLPQARLWLVTRGGWNGSPQQAVFWGLGRTLALEQASAWGGIVDLDPACDPDVSADQLAALLLSDGTEDQLLFRDGKSFAARLEKVPADQVLTQPAPFDEQASYLITGGLGAIGLDLAQAMAGRGAGTLVLMGRTPLPARNDWSDVDPDSGEGRKIAAISRIESLGARVVPVALDVSDDGAFQAWYADFQAAGYGPVKGVVHAAGFADRVAFANIDASTMTAHLGAKMGGALVLDRRLDEAPLDFFISLSSAAALLSSPELAAYGAANAFLDALALQRRARGKPGLSIGWGPWRDAGMATEGFDSSFKAIRALSAVEALELMDRLWCAKAGYLAVLPIDWDLWLRHYPSAAAAPLLADVLEGRGASPASRGEQYSVLSALPAAQRHDFLLSWLKEHIADIFAMTPEDIGIDEPLSAQGMDSLMALEIRNAIEGAFLLPLQIVELLAGISITELAGLLAGSVDGQGGEDLSFIAASGEQQTPFSLSHGQQALWLIHELAPDSSAYNVAFALAFKDPLDVAAIRENFRFLVQRHPALRTVMNADGPEVSQRVLEQPDFGFEVIDAASWDEARLKQEVAEAYARPFDLATGPLFRVHLFERGEGDFIILLVAHHIICDGWSLWVLIDAFGELCEGNPDDNAPLPISYGDYVDWQQRLLNGVEGEKLWAFWRQRLGGALPVLNLPTDRPRPLVQTYAGSTSRFLLPRELSARLSAFARDNGATDYMVLLAVYNVLLHRYTGQTEFLVGCPTSGRNSDTLSGLVGHFINPVVMRSDLSGDPSFQDFLIDTRAVVLDALAHQEYPFSLIVEKIQPVRDPGCSPIFQTDFTLQRPQQAKGIIDMMIPDGAEAAPLQWGSFDPVPYEIDQQEGQFELSFEAVEGAGSYFCFLKYNTDLFDAATMERMGGHLRNLLESVLDTPDEKISRLPMISAGERKMLLHHFNDTAADYPNNTTITLLFEEQAARTPDKIAIVHGQQSETYSQLNARANRIAALLRSLAVMPGDFVGILDSRGVDFLAAILGILKAGGAYVPIDPDYPDERIHYMVDNSQVEVLISREAVFSTAYSSASLRHVVLVDGQGADLAAENPDLHIHPQGVLAQQDEANPDPLNVATDRAYMIYTSGSSGTPKGAIIRHDGALNHIFAQYQALGFHADSAFLQSAPSSSDISVWQFLAPVLIGGRCVVADFVTVCSAENLFDLITTQKVTIFELVPAVLAELLDYAQALPASNLDDLQWAMVTGEATTVDLVNRWFAVFPDVPLVNAYGPTEAADDICQYVLHAALPSGTHNVPIGAPLGNLKLYILDHGLGLVPPGIGGEICVSGIGVGEGYWCNPEKTAERFVDNPYAEDSRHAVIYRTGDQGRWLADGNIEFLGRDDDQVKIRGYRIELGEIEATLTRHDDIRQALVVVWQDANQVKRLVAYIRCLEGKQLSSGEIRNFAAASLPAHMLPTSCVFVDAFPVLPNGKINRKALADPEAAAQSDSVGEAPRNACENRIATIWKDALQRDKIGIDDNFFELGGHSLMLARLHRRIESEFATTFPLVKMFQYPSVKSLAGFLQPGDSQGGASHAAPRVAPSGSPDIAIIGMSCRFPGASDVEEYWRNLRDKVESVTFFSDAELLARGASPQMLENPDFVRGCATLEGLDLFDAGFFGYNAREAEIMDPQQRLFLECAWQALEDAGYDLDSSTELSVGCFAGQGATAYLNNNVHPNFDTLESAYLYQVEISNDKDYLATNAGYKLNLQGPCVTVQSACSTSLVAIHMACKSLQDGECDMALAGSVSANVLHQAGYLYQQGMILSPDGHCRPFDKDAGGTIPGSGLAVVTLKKLDQALADGDTVHAVIKGSAVNNDGSLKAGYTAPSVEGQIKAIERAYASAGVDPRSVGYLAAHGTATPMGDPIEIEALVKVFGGDGSDVVADSCAIGSVKANIGHTDTAAGIASLIAAVMAIKKKQIPPLLNFVEANPAIDFSGTPFFLNSQPVDWQSKGAPRRAGVSSLGIGGTNVHMVLEEAPQQGLANNAESHRPLQLLALSAQSAQALDGMRANMVKFLGRSGNARLSDVAYTLAVGRRKFAHRQIVLGSDAEEASAALAGDAPGRVFAGQVTGDARPVTFMFSGQGSQYVNMGRELYNAEPIFRAIVDQCLDTFKHILAIDLGAVLFVAEGSQADGGVDINQTLVAQPLIFTIEYATAKLLERWGVRPDSMIGHSIGEYAAACLAGVFSLEDAISLVARRARLMQDLPGGAMTAVQLPARQLEGYLDDGLSLAAENSSRLSVVSGPKVAIEKLEQRLQGEDKSFRRLHTSHAFHSAAMDAVEKPFSEHVRTISLKPPRIPFISNLSGTWITAEQATDPAYWFQHLRQSVRFSKGLDILLDEDTRILLEVGPGNALSIFALQHEDKKRGQLVIGCHPAAQEKTSGTQMLLKSLARLWVAGGDVDWNGFYDKRRGRRIPLPTYPFESQRYWIEANAQGAQTARREEETSAKRGDVGDWFAVPSWRRARLEGVAVEDDIGPWLVFLDESGFGEGVVGRLRERGCHVITVTRGDGFTGSTQHGYNFDPADKDSYKTLFDGLAREGCVPGGVLHFWGYTGKDNKWRQHIDDGLDAGFSSLFHIGKELGRHYNGEKTYLKAVLSDSQDVSGLENLNSLKGCVPGLLKVIGQEYPAILCQSVDFAYAAKASTQMVEQLINELSCQSPEPLVALRGKFRWVQHFEEIRLDPPKRENAGLKDQGVYLITGGLGVLGGLLARHLASKVAAKLVLVGRTPVPQRATWPDEQDKDSRDGRNIRQIQELENLGAEVLTLSCDVASAKGMKTVVKQAVKRFGRIDGVIHAAGVTDQDFPIEDTTPEIYAAHFEPKIKGTIALDQALKGVEIDFCLLFSSLSAHLGGLRFAPYAAANLFMDAYTLLRNRSAETPWTSICWDGWLGEDEGEEMPAAIAASRASNTIGRNEGLEAFDRIAAMQARPDQLIVSVTPLQSRIEKWIVLKDPQALSPVQAGAQTFYQRPDLATPYVAAQTQKQKEIAEIWQDLLGVSEVGIHDNFFEMGGHSLLGTQLISRLRQRYRVEANIGALFDAPTVDGLVDYIEDLSPEVGGDEEREEFLI
jgi:amino acid adenylation domain-containing protein